MPPVQGLQVGENSSAPVTFWLGQCWVACKRGYWGNLPVDQNPTEINAARERHTKGAERWIKGDMSLLTQLEQCDGCRWTRSKDHRGPQKSSTRLVYFRIRGNRGGRSFVGRRIRISRVRSRNKLTIRCRTTRGKKIIKIKESIWSTSTTCTYDAKRG